ncbi:unnamed protein product [Gadus morhua 'NCC']
MSVTSQTRIYDVRLMSSVNALSNRVLGSALLQEFTPPGKPTGELIAVEYLLAQSNRGDLLSAPDAIGANLPEGPEEVQEDEFPDETIPQATDILFPSSSPEPTAESEGASRSPVSSPFEDSGPITSTPDSRCDPSGIPGWEAVDALAGYLVSLNRTITALSNQEIADILRLYSSLDGIDKSPTKYSLKNKKTTLPGPWRASRKRSGSAPGQQAAERLFMVHGQAAHRPDYTRVSECVALKLFKEFKEGRNRPKDPKGRTFPIPQAIVMTYGHIKQLIEDCQQILQSTNLVLVTINNTTVSSWLQDRQKRADRDSLLQGVELPQQVHVAEESLLEALDLPSEPVPHGHADLEFEEPDNREGEAVIRRRRRKTQVSSEDAGGDDAWTVPFPSSSDLAYCEQRQHPAPVSQSQSWYPYQPPSAPASQSRGWSPYQLPPTPESQYQAWASYQRPPASHSQGWSGPSYQPPPPPPAAHFQSWSSNLPPPPPPAAHSQGSYQLPPVPDSPPQDGPSNQPDPASHNRYREWRLQKAAFEDQERAMRGEPPKKRQSKESYHYQCKMCGKAKSKLTGHTQLRGKWYCPASGKTIEEWKSSL